MRGQKRLANQVLGLARLRGALLGTGGAQSLWVGGLQNRMSRPAFWLSATELRWSGARDLPRGCTLVRWPYQNKGFGVRAIRHVATKATTAPAIPIPFAPAFPAGDAGPPRNPPAPGRRPGPGPTTDPA